MNEKPNDRGLSGFDGKKGDGMDKEKRKERLQKGFMAAGIGLFFNYCMIHNIPLLIFVLKTGVILGLTMVLKEVWVLLFIKKTDPKELTADLGGRFLLWVAYVVCLFFYFAFLFVVLRW